MSELRTCVGIHTAHYSLHQHIQEKAALTGMAFIYNFFEEVSAFLRIRAI